MDDTRMVQELRKLAAAQDSNYLRTMTNKCADDLAERIAVRVRELRAAALEMQGTSVFTTLHNLADMYESGRLAL